jgi:hypothetical protein
MKFRRVAAAVAAAAMIAGGVSLAVAPAASAITVSTLTITGSATLSWTPASSDYYLLVCAPETVVADDCGTVPGPGPNLLYLIADGDPSVTSHTFAPGDMVEPYSGSSEVPLPAGDYAFVLVDFNNGVTSNVVHGTVADTYIPIPPWVQGYGRASAADVCLDGWTASWELWPNGGTGGWVCTRSIPSLG